MRNNKTKESNNFASVTTTYENSKKYVDVGWKIISIRNVILHGVDKEIQECCLVWDGNTAPIYPQF